MSLIDGQWQIGNLVFGRDTWYATQPPDFGGADMIVNDVPRPGQDGLRIGRETRQGRTITFEIGVMGNGLGKPGGQEMYDRLASLYRNWSFEPQRDFPSLCQPLIYSRGGVMRRVYGRPRRFNYVFPDSDAQWIDVTADYQTIDHYTYSETTYYSTVGSVSASIAGIRDPLLDPITAVQATSSLVNNPIRVGGTSPTWLRMFVFGPTQGFEVEIAGQFSVKMPITLAYDQWVIIDPTPWGQMVRRNDLANLAGYMSWESPPLSKMRVQPGSWRVNYKAKDPTGTSFVYLDWRNCFHGI